VKRKLINALCALMLTALTGCVAFVFVGCQTRVTWEKNPETALPIQSVVTVNGIEQLATTGYQMAGGGWLVTARSPLWAKEQFSGFSLSLGTNGEISVSLNSYDRDLSTNAVVMTKTIFDGSANLALAVAKAYATIQTGGASEAIVGKVVSFFKSKGGDASKSTVTSDGTTIKVTDGSTCITCDAAGNCTDCTPQ
jgi:hypothetical protein